MKMYGTMMCPDTVYADKVLRKNGIDIEYVDITASMANMKEFLSLRDNRQEFDQVKENGKAGVPVFLLDDDSVIFDVYSIDKVDEKVEKEPKIKDLTGGKEFKGCSIDGGC